jgi:hypothetical protein
MISATTASPFELLLSRLDREADTAGEKYVELRLKITKILEWKGCPESHAESLADTVLDRIAGRLAAGEVIENINGYAAGVARFVWLEHSRKYREDAAGDLIPELSADAQLGLAEDVDKRLACLRKCLVEISATDEDRRLIVEYYDTDPGGKSKDKRKLLAESLGLSASALKVRAFRLRARLEACINHCAGSVTKTAGKVTMGQEGM